MGNTTNSKYREYYEAFIKSRKDYYWAWVYSIIAYIFALVLFAYSIKRFSYFYLRIAEELWPVIVAGPAAALSPLVFKATVDVRRKYKKLLVWSVMEKVFSDLHVQPEGKLSYAELQAAGLHVDVNAKQNDWFCGNYNGVSFILCDVMQMRFKGRILIVEFVSVHDKRDAFEPPLFRKFDLEQEMESVYIQIRQITDLIEAVTGQNHTENLQSTD